MGLEFEKKNNLKLKKNNKKKKFLLRIKTKKMALEDYTHLLNLINWFNEASIQSKLNEKFNGNKGTLDVEAITEPTLLEDLRTELVLSRDYLFNKPDVTSSSTFLVPESDVTIAATWAGVGKNLITSTVDHIVGSKLVFEEWKEKAWNNEHETGLYHNTFTFEDDDHIGIAVSLLDVVIVLIIKTTEDNSKKPKRPHPSSSDPSDERGVCTDGLDISICDDDEEEDDDCVVEALCDTNFQPAN